MILAIANARFPQTFDGHATDASRQPKLVTPLTVDDGDTVRISSQALAAQASYRRVREGKRLGLASASTAPE